MRYLFVIIIVLFINCKKPNEKFDYCYGDFILTKLYYKGDCLSCNDTYSLYIDKKTNWLIIENRLKKEKIKAKYKLYLSPKHEVFLDVYNSNNKKFDGEYLIEFDTILNSPQRDEFKISIQSNEIYMESYKSIVKKIG